MMKRLLVCLLVLSGIVSAWAQQQQPLPHHMDMEKYLRQEMADITAACKLTPQQQIRLESIYVQSGAEVMALYRQPNTNVRAMLQRMNTIENNRKNAIRGMLSPEQLTRYEAFLARGTQQNPPATGSDLNAAPRNAAVSEAPAARLVDRKIAKAEAQTAMKTARRNRRSEKKARRG